MLLQPPGLEHLLLSSLKVTDDARQAGLNFDNDVAALNTLVLMNQVFDLLRGTIQTTRGKHQIAKLRNLNLPKPGLALALRRNLHGDRLLDLSRGYLLDFGQVRVIEATPRETRGNMASGQAMEMHQIAIRPTIVLETCPTQSLIFCLRARIASPMLISEITPRAINK